MWLLVAPQFAVVSPYYKFSLVIGNGQPALQRQTGGLGGEAPQGMIGIFKE